MAPIIGLTASTNQGTSDTFWAASTVNRSYTEWIERAGGLPLLLPNPDPRHIDQILAAVDGLLFTGGADIAPLLYGAEPAKDLGTTDIPRDRFELPLGRAALAAELPILGICRGIQLLNVAAGGSLRQDLKGDPAAVVQHQMSVVGGRGVHHHVTVEPGTRLAGLVGSGRLAVNSYHHQAVDRLGPGLRVTARADDGTIEAIEGAGQRFLMAVQWHPEVMDPEHAPSAALFAAFVTACGPSAA
jgi:putative glutamine amidotransferase